jgi:hypothetical protein
MESLPSRHCLESMLHRSHGREGFEPKLLQNYCSSTARLSHKLRSADESEFRKWSGARDLNPGPHGPEPLQRSVRGESPEAI